MKGKLLILFLLVSCFSKAQVFSRIQAEFSIKSKEAGGKGQLNMGKVFFDRSANRIVYQNSFPEKTTTVVFDTALYNIRDGKVVSRVRSPLPIAFSTFALLLSGDFKSFGLEKMGYEIEKVEKEKEMVITTWKPKAGVVSPLGKVLTSSKDQKLFGIIIYDKNEKMISKQFFKNYTSVNGLKVPQELIQITFGKNNEENYQVTTFKNILVNNMNESTIYNYCIPK